MAGGNPTLIDRVEPLPSTIAKRVIRVGDRGRRRGEAGGQ